MEFSASSILRRDLCECISHARAHTHAYETILHSEGTFYVDFAITEKSREGASTSELVKSVHYSCANSADRGD